MVAVPSRHLAGKLTLKSDTKAVASQPNPPGSLAGSWKAVAGTGDEATVAGYRVQEKFAAGVAKATAAGRTNDVTGSATVTGTTVTAADFDVNMTTLHSDKSQRDERDPQSGAQSTSSHRHLQAVNTDPAATDHQRQGVRT